MVRRKAQSALITGLDIGSTAIRIVVGQLTEATEGKHELQMLGMVEVPSEGVHKGVITSIEETVSSLSHALEQVERLTGVPVEHAWVGISGMDIIAQESRGVVAVAKSDGEISDDDVSRAVDAARTVAVPLNYEILHVIPRSFNVDGQTNIKDPVGMTGIRLEVNAQMIYGVTSHIKNVTKAVYRTGIDIDDLVLSILATGDAVTTSRQRELGVAVVNIGGSTTSIVVYEAGDIVHTAVLPLGSEHITNDLAIGLRSSIDIAERVKLEYGTCIAKGIPKREKIDMAALGAGDAEHASLQYTAEIIGARVEEILEKVDEELDRVGRSGRLPAGVVFTGGGAKIDGLVPFAKNALGLPARLGEPLFISGVAQKGSDLSFASAIGLVKWGAHVYEGGRPASYSRFTSAGKVVKRLQDVWRSLIP